MQALSKNRSILLPQSVLSQVEGAFAQAKHSFRSQREPEFTEGASVHSSTTLDTSLCCSFTSAFRLTRGPRASVDAGVRVTARC